MSSRNTLRFRAVPAGLPAFRCRHGGLGRLVGVAALATICAALTTATGAAAQGVVNGGFETPAVDGGVLRTAPSAFGGWTVDAGQVVHTDERAFAAPASGAQSIGLSGSFGSLTSLSQIVAVEPERRYRLSLRFADGGGDADPAPWRPGQI